MEFIIIVVFFIIVFVKAGKKADKKEKSAKNYTSRNESPSAAAEKTAPKDNRRRYNPIPTDRPGYVRCPVCRQTQRSGKSRCEICGVSFYLTSMIDPVIKPESPARPAAQEKKADTPVTQAAGTAAGRKGPIVPLLDGQTGFIRCPACGARQSANRQFCFRCCAVFADLTKSEPASGTAVQEEAAKKDAAMPVRGETSATAEPKTVTTDTPSEQPGQAEPPRAENIAGPSVSSEPAGNPEERPVGEQPADEEKGSVTAEPADGRKEGSADQPLPDVSDGIAAETEPAAPDGIPEEQPEEASDRQPEEASDGQPAMPDDASEEQPEEAGSAPSVADDIPRPEDASAVPPEDAHIAPPEDVCLAQPKGAYSRRQEQNAVKRIFSTQILKTAVPLPGDALYVCCPVCCAGQRNDRTVCYACGALLDRGSEGAGSSEACIPQESTTSIP